MKTPFYQTQLFGYLMALLGAFGAAVYYIPYKLALKEVGSGTFVALVFFLSILLHLLWLLQRSMTPRGRKHIRQNLFNRYTLAVGLITGAISALANYAAGESIIYINPAITSVIQRSQEIFIVFMGIFFLKERFSWIILWGAFVSFLGIALITTAQGRATFNLESTQFLGVFWALLSALCFGLFQVIVKKYIKNIDALSMNLLRLFLGTLFLFLSPSIIHDLMNLSSDVIYYAFLSALFGPCLSRLAYIWALRLIPVSRSVFMTMTTPLFLLVLTNIAFHTFPTTQELWGSSLVLLGILFPLIAYLEKRRRRHKKSKTPEIPVPPHF